jgi:hypothetical protein
VRVYVLAYVSVRVCNKKLVCMRVCMCACVHVCAHICACSCVCAPFDFLLAEAWSRLHFSAMTPLFCMFNFCVNSLKAEAIDGRCLEG